MQGVPKGALWGPIFKKKNIKKKYLKKNIFYFILFIFKKNKSVSPMQGVPKGALWGPYRLISHREGSAHERTNCPLTQDSKLLGCHRHPNLWDGNHRQTGHYEGTGMERRQKHKQWGG